MHPGLEGVDRKGGVCLGMSLKFERQADISMHSYANGNSTPIKQANWELVCASSLHA